MPGLRFNEYPPLGREQRLGGRMMFNNRWRKVPAQKNAFREKLILAEYDFQRREFHAVHSPTLLGGALAVNVAIGVYIFNQREILLKFIASGQDFWYILIYCYGFLFLFAFFSAIRSAIMGGFTLQRFAIEKEYDKILAELSRGIEGDPQSRSEILDQAELKTFEIGNTHV